MKLFLPAVAPLLFLSPAASAQDEVTYQANLDIYDITDEQKAFYMFVMPVEMVQGSAANVSPGDAEWSPLIGNLRQNTESGRIDTDLTICLPDRKVCEAIAKPDLSFSAGETATFHVSGPRYTVTLTLSPTSQASDAA